MIPKKIHYCWLSGEKIPSLVKECIDSWKEVMPEYEITLWDESKFDTSSIPFVNEACNVKKWAFAADYIRLYALYNEGGIYLDSDVIVKKNFEPYLKHQFFSSVEYHPNAVVEKNALSYLKDDGSSIVPFTPIPGIGIQAAIIAGVKGLPFFKDCMDYYHNNHFIQDNGQYNDKVIAPAIFAMNAEKYGFKYKNNLQHLDNDMLILPSDIFASTLQLANDNAYAIHICSGSWRKKDSLNIISRFVNRIKKNTIIRKIFRKKNVA